MTEEVTPWGITLELHCATRVTAHLGCKTRLVAPSCHPECIQSDWVGPPLQVAPGDVLVVASDGLFDNLFDEEIANLVDATMDVRPQ